MCKMVEIERDAVPSNITIEFERDASMRVVEVVIINRGRDGAECQGIVLVCADSGKIISVSTIADMKDGVGIVA